MLGRDAGAKSARRDVGHAAPCHDDAPSTHLLPHPVLHQPLKYGLFLDDEQEAGGRAPAQRGGQARPGPPTPSSCEQPT